VRRPTDRERMTVAAFIPARMGSTRFPGKPLALLAGQPIIQHVHAAARAAPALQQIYVCTDDPRIARAVAAFGGTALMTRADHASGTDRIVEALGAADPAGLIDIVVNIQGDEPLIRPGHIQRCVEQFAATPGADWATLVYPLVSEKDWANPNVVKVVRDVHGFALYFSRAPVPYNRDGSASVPRAGHIGLYAYRTEALRRFASLPPTPLEATERLEQLRALEHGMKILCVEVGKAEQGIDTPEDLAHAERILAAHPEYSNITVA